MDNGGCCEELNPPFSPEPRIHHYSRGGAGPRDRRYHCHFSIVNTVLLKPLPVSDPNRLVMLVTTGVSDTGESESDIDASPAKFAHWRAQSSVLQEVSALLAGVVNYTGGDAVEQWRSMQVSVDSSTASWTRALGARAIQK
ncbi:MAG TPA: hypothetical protein VGF49_02835 [Candidatus Solibacter sp.]